MSNSIGIRNRNMSNQKESKAEVRYLNCPQKSGCLGLKCFFDSKNLMKVFDVCLCEKYFHKGIFVILRVCFPDQGIFFCISVLLGVPCEIVA